MMQGVTPKHTDSDKKQLVIDSGCPSETWWSDLLNGNGFDAVELWKFLKTPMGVESSQTMSNLH